MEARHQLPWYLHGVPHSVYYKTQLVKVDTLDDIRKIAIDNDIPVANKPDSQEICFIPNDDYITYLETGKPEFYGEYMTQYSWAEETCAMLQFKK